MKIAIVDTFFSGSHKQWGLDLQHNSKYQIQLFTLPGIHWKWRMQGGAITLAQKLNNTQFKPDLILATDMVNLSIFKSLLGNDLQNVPIILYFHENQLMYPKSKMDTDEIQKRDNHYGFINFSSSLIADKILFNSTFHLSGFICSLKYLLKKFPDYSFVDLISNIRNKSSVLPIGIQLNNDNKLKTKNKISTILWNHRWEHDKNPEQFFNTLFNLKAENIRFRLNVIGKNYKNSPKIFDKAKITLKDEIINWGFVESKAEYYKILNQSDILPVTSHHDFFGISTVEAMSCGVYPLLPNRLAYPEHIPAELKSDCLYNNSRDLYQKLKLLLKGKIPNHMELIKNQIQNYELKKVINDYDQFFESTITGDI